MDGDASTPQNYYFCLAVLSHRSLDSACYKVSKAESRKSRVNKFNEFTSEKAMCVHFRIRDMEVKGRRPPGAGITDSLRCPAWALGIQFGSSMLQDLNHLAFKIILYL